MRATVDIALRWGDQDAYGHVNNVAFARFLEEARVRLFWLGVARESTGLEQHFRADNPEGPLMLVANQQIEFVRVLNYSEHPVQVQTWIGRLGGSSLEVHYEISTTSGGDPGAESSVPSEVVARAVTTIVMVDPVTTRPVRLTPEARASISDWQDAPLKLGRR